MTAPEQLPPRSVAARLLLRFRRVTTSGAFIAEIDGLRFNAIFLVVLFHLAIGLYLKAPAQFAPPAKSALAAVAWNGFRGVELFFVISGFVLALPFAQHRLNGAPRVGLGAYLLRRVTRLEPPYIACMLLLFVLDVTIKGRAASQLWPHLLASLGYVHNLVFVAESPINNVAWSLEIEIQFYLLAPLLSLVFAIRSKALRRAVIGAAALAATMAAWGLVEPGSRASLSIARFLQFFLAGFLLADVYLTDWKQRPTRSLRWDLVSLVGWPVLVFAWSRAAYLVPGQPGDREPLGTALLFPAATFVLYAAAFRGTITNRIFVNPAIATIGGMCYTIYLLHNRMIGPILSLTRSLSPFPSYAANLLLQLAIVGPLLLIPSALYFAAVEKPCMRKDWPRRLRARVQSLWPQVSAG